MMFFLVSCGTQKHVKQDILLEDETKLMISYYQTSDKGNSPEYTI